MRFTRLWRPAAGTTLVMAGATAVSAALDQYVPTTVLALVYIGAVLLVAHRYAYGYAFASTLAAVVLLNLIFLQPRGELRVDSQEHGLGLAALLVVSLLASYLAARQREFGRAATRNTQRATQLRELASALAVTTDIDAMSDSVLTHLRARFGNALLAIVDPAHIEAAALRSQRSTPAAMPVHLLGKTEASPAPVSDDALRHCIHSGQSLGAGTRRWDNLSGTCVPMLSAAGVLGAIAVVCDETNRHDDVIEVQAVADMLAAAIQRERSAADALQARVEVQSQALRNTLLASISHDFRTPLASIIGSASALVQQHARLAPSDAIRLAAQIESEARYLAEVTENTLHWIRLTSGGPAPDFDWQAPGEILSAVIERARLRDPAVDLQLKLEPDLPLVRGDAVLLAQAVANLMDNAVKYAEGPILVSASLHDGRLSLDVADRGPTLSPQERQRIFQTFYRSPNALGIRGAGLGLSIAQAVAHAHGGGMTVMPRQDGGNIFRLDLPLADVPPIAPDFAADDGPDVAAHADPDVPVDEASDAAPAIDSQTREAARTKAPES